MFYCYCFGEDKVKISFKILSKLLAREWKIKQMVDTLDRLIRRDLSSLSGAKIDELILKDSCLIIRNEI